MSMIKRANGEIKTFTNEEGKEVEAKSDLVWADEKDDKPIKDELLIPTVTDMDLDVNATDDSDDVIAKDC